jgi:hypothetical protein
MFLPGTEKSRSRKKERKEEPGQLLLSELWQ